MKGDFERGYDAGFKAGFESARNNQNFAPNTPYYQYYTEPWGAPKIWCEVR